MHCQFVLNVFLQCCLCVVLIGRCVDQSLLKRVPLMTDSLLSRQSAVVLSYEAGGLRWTAAVRHSECYLKRHRPVSFLLLCSLLSIGSHESLQLVVPAQDISQHLHPTDHIPYLGHIIVSRGPPSEGPHQVSVDK